MMASIRDKVIAFVRSTGGDGASTAKVAEACECSLATARQHLWAAERDDLVIATDEGASGCSGNPIYWICNDPR